MLVLLVLAWLPVFTSTVLLIVFWLTDDLPGRQRPVFVIWFAIAVWLQFFATPPVLPTVGLVTQALLAIILALRLKLR